MRSITTFNDHNLAILYLVKFNASLVAICSGVKYYVQEECEGSFQLYSPEKGVKWATFEEIEGYEVKMAKTDRSQQPSGSVNH